MKVEFHRRFIKIYHKRIVSNRSLDIKFKERTKAFEKNSADLSLHDHSLKGKSIGLRSFSITGDVRVIYKIEGGKAYFLDIGTHNQVY